MYPFDRFDEACQQVLEQANAEAERLRDSEIGTEHLVLAMLRRPGVAGRALARLGVTPEGFATALAGVEHRPPGQPGAMQPTGRAKRAIEHAFRVSMEGGQRWIATHHLLLGVMAEGQGVGVHALAALGAGAEEVRRAIESELTAGGEEPEGPRPNFSQRLWDLMHQAEDLAALEGAPAVESDHVRLAMTADAPALMLARRAQDIQVRRLAALENADHEDAARLRAEEAAVRERLVTALAEWRRLAG